MSGMRLLDFVQQHDAVRMLPHGIDEQAALLEADVSGRRANQPRHGVLLHVLAHVEADELVAEQQRELLGQLRLADAGRAGEEEAASGTFGLAQSGARPLDRLRDQVHRFVLPEHHAAQRLFERPQPVAIGRGGLPVGDPRDARGDPLDFARVDHRRLGDNGPAGLSG